MKSGKHKITPVNSVVDTAEVRPDHGEAYPGLRCRKWPEDFQGAMRLLEFVEYLRDKEGIVSPSLPYRIL